jgi:hypothetical protein
MTVTRFALAMLLGASMASGLREACAGEFHAKSERTALQYSLLGTMVPIGAGTFLVGDGAGAGVVLGAAVIGPSLGHFYAARPARAAIGIGIRSASVLGLALAIGSAWENEGTDASLLGVGCLIIGTASMITDIAEAPRSARIHNAKKRDPRMCVLPCVLGPARAAGLAVRIQF